MKILLIENEQLILTELSSFLTKEEHKVTVSSVDKAFGKINSTEYDCIVLSIGNQLEKWVQFIEQLNNENRTDGLIIISKSNSLEFMIHCFDLGIDDYLAHPFQIEALYARLKAVVRRRKFNVKRKLYFSNLTIDFHRKRIYVMDIEVNFTKIEYEIVLYLFSNENQPKTKESLVKYLWNDSLNDLKKLNNVLFTHIKNIRTKLEKSNATLVIKNNYGAGYQIEEL